jgi:hypothetical protein
MSDRPHPPPVLPPHPDRGRGAFDGAAKAAKPAGSSVEYGLMANEKRMALEHLAELP